MTNAIKDTARDRPGALLESGITAMERFLAPMVRGSGGMTTDARLTPSAVAYFTTVLRQARGGNLSIRAERELRTLAEAIDLLLRGDVAQVGDLLMQRFKAIEATTGDMPWAVAQHLELIPQSQVTALADEERAAAASIELRESRLRAAVGSRH
jgi:hypothetical protein